ncbi:MAG: hypothetical protein AB1746_01250 [Candidatus Zixiibacteriota bacterium]
MADIKFILEKDELARQIHFILRELYPDINIDPKLVHGLVVETAPGGAGFRFDSALFAEKANLDKKQLTAGLYRELGVEFEKNWHDKSYFEIKQVGDSIEFRLLNRKENDKR